MRVLVCGGRRYNRHAHIYHTLDAIHDETPISAIIVGGAPGADRWAESWAWMNKSAVDCVCYPAGWAELGRAAGPIRNQRMIDDGRPDLVVAFSRRHRMAGGQKIIEGLNDAIAFQRGDTTRGKIVHVDSDCAVRWEGITAYIGRVKVGKACYSKMYGDWFATRIEAGVEYGINESFQSEAEARAAVEKLAREALGLPADPDPRDARISDLEAAVVKLREALAWVDQVNPKTLSGRRVRVEMTRDEFNAMRAALGLPTVAQDKRK